MSINQEKFSALNRARKTTFTNVSNAISQLNTHALTAIKQQAYMRKNPDNNGADMQKVQAGEMTVESLISKYSIDLAAFSAELI